MIANLTFDELTPNEKAYIERKGADALGAKDLTIAGKNFRVLAAQFGEEVSMVHFEGHHRKSEEELIEIRHTLPVSVLLESFPLDAFWAWLSKEKGHQIQEKGLL